ncbi:hypothetical protein SKAU_G00164280 [Synaphobranchus kaupii]|uniref:Uncharacterized protein n=1 Tax=Synaphobranchus kaupii TaxID=118154 RepID=A0A9Q1FJ43_SYNKA|nr:hypothetical protein SKAU_G00164280 [Synaphobranchus kaupii]
MRPKLEYLQVTVDGILRTKCSILWHANQLLELYQFIITAEASQLDLNIRNLLSKVLNQLTMIIDKVVP